MMRSVPAAMAETATKDGVKAPVPAAETSKTPKAAEAKPANKQELPGEYVDDTVITTKVKAAVLGDAALKSAEINVETYKGVVQLSGFVRSRADIDKAVAHAKAVKGATSVKNDMVVKGKQ